uniref:FXYD domain-containing ion transport regulator n=1 Tax=Aotus nancymaae TaxID=37293 RepID=A0A2K5DDF3_AOTNA
MGRGNSGASQARGGLEEPLERGLRGLGSTQAPLHGTAAAYLSAQRDASLPARGQHSDMQKVTLGLLVFLAGLPVLDANDPEDKNSPFYYDWHRLQVGGLICAGVLCALGIIILMSGKCKCKFRQKPGHRPGEAPPLITPGSAHNC